MGQLHCGGEHMQLRVALRLMSRLSDTTVPDVPAAVNVFLGNLLILPTTIAWVSAMDGMDLFPASYSKLPPTCAPCK